MVCPAWHTYRAHHTAIRSNRMSSCMHCLRPAICNTVRTPWSSDRRRSECIGTTLSHKPDISSRYIRPYSTRIPYCKSFCSVYSLTVDTAASHHCNSWDRDNHYHHDTSPPIWVCNCLCSRVPAMGCIWPAASMCTAVYRGSDAVTLDNSNYLCSLLPSHSRIPRPDPQHHCRIFSVVALQISKTKLETDDSNLIYICKVEVRPCIIVECRNMCSIIRSV